MASILSRLMIKMILLFAVFYNSNCDYLDKNKCKTQPLEEMNQKTPISEDVFSIIKRKGLNEQVKKILDSADVAPKIIYPCIQVDLQTFGPKIEIIRFTNFRSIPQPYELIKIQTKLESDDEKFMEILKDPYGRGESRIMIDKTFMLNALDLNDRVILELRIIQNYYWIEKS